MSEQIKLIKADTVYGLIQSVNDVLRDRFTSKGRTLDDNSWRTCNAYSLEVGFWKAVRDSDFGSVLTYSAMLAGRGVNVADIIMNSIDASSERIGKMEAGAITNLDTIRLQRITIEQHEKTIADLRAKLSEKGAPEPYLDGFFSGAALESKLAPEICYSVESVCGEMVETTVIQGDPVAVKDLVQMVRAEKSACGNRAVNNVVIHSPDPRIAELVGAATGTRADSRELFTLDATELQSRVNRLQIATGLILQLPCTHDGRATWLLNYATHNDPDVQQEIRKRPRAFASIADVVECVHALRPVQS